MVQIPPPLFIFNMAKEKERLLNIPNVISLSRVLFVFIAVYMLFLNSPRLYIAIVFGIAALTDFFDGYFARALNQKTRIGARLDVIIDRIFTLIIVSALFFYLTQLGIPLIYLVLVLSREIIALPGFLIRVASGRDYYSVKFNGKFTTFVQSFTIGWMILGFNGIIYLVALTFISGLISGFDYLRDSIK